MSEKILPFVLRPDTRASARLSALDDDHQRLNDLAASLGSPEEWQTTAFEYLKTCVREEEARPVPAAGMSVTVSVAALRLVLARLETLENGSRPCGDAA